MTHGNTPKKRNGIRGPITSPVILLVMAFMIVINITGCATDTAPNEEGASDAPGTTDDATEAPPGSGGITVTQLPLGTCTTTIECDPGRYAECLSGGATIACVDNACVATGGSVDLDCVVDHAVGANETACGDGLDNDSDTLVDCRDPDCLALSCNDANSCTTGDVCGAGGTCVGGAVIPDPGPPASTCFTRVCDPETGWGSTPAANGTSCADGDLCDGTETCQAGACTDGPDLLDPAPTPPTCNTRVCSPATGWSNAPVVNGTSCADANLCNGSEICQAGACTDQVNLSCDDGLFCNGAEACNPTTGCLDAPDPIVADAVTCTIDSCDEETDTIIHTPDNTVCDDGNLCTTDYCNRTSDCVNAVTPDFGPPAPTCQSRECSPAFGWRNVAVVNGTSCANANLCDGTETCQAGACTDGPDLSCGDGLFCNGAEVCNPATGCGTGTPVSCTTTALCATSSCVEALDACVDTPVADGLACNDGFSCSTSSLCVAGDCISATPDNDLCDDGLTVDPAALDICVAGYTESVGVNATDHPMVDDRGCVRCYSTSDPRCVDIFGDLLSDILPPEGTVVQWCYTAPPAGQTWYGSISYGLTGGGWSFNPDIPLVSNCANYTVPTGTSFVWIDGTSGLQTSPSIWWLGPNGNPPTSIAVNGINYPVPTYTPTSASGSGFRVNLP